MEARLRRSPRAAVLIAVGFAATAVVVAATPLALPLRIAIMLWLFASSVEALMTVAWHAGARGVARLRVERSGAVGVENARGVCRTGILRDGSVIAPWLTVVRWRPEGARFDRTVPILPDMLDPETFRRLRVLLKWL